MDEWSETIALN